MGYTTKITVTRELDVESPEQIRINGSEEYVDVSMLDEDAVVGVVVAYIRGICQDASVEAWSVAQEVARKVEDG